ncbi:MAG: hypothetical protein ALECFALPRED_007406 [Alectoria fallacina]|uniref:Uncharacterized protein n=1 Tax=Alectoria fallacina TaxID=1903189 RepID=A0A8H3EUD4_9LECA|nr:MAG: hypothetical protein ALECFALPRED_007406 [Alectoria fallacina]
MLTPQDCTHVINEILLREEGVFEPRLFRDRTYVTATGADARSQWQYGQCQISVLARRGAWQSLTLFDVALTANRIIQICVSGVAIPKGGGSIIGEVSKGFFVHVEGYLEDSRMAENVTSSYS